MIAIIDYGVGNLFSLSCSFSAIGAETVITGDEAVIKDLFYRVLGRLVMRHGNYANADFTTL